MRRKLAPNPVVTAVDAGLAPRPLVAMPARTARVALPTAAALALALAALGCSGAEPEEAISADKVLATKVKAAPSVAPSASASAAIAPTPVPLPGEAAIVVPPPPAPSSSHPKLGGKPMVAHPTI